MHAQNAKGVYRDYELGRIIRAAIKCIVGLYREALLLL
jgi:hypothetical protein